MNKEIYTSLELSKKLHEAGCNFATDYMWVKYSLWKKPKLIFSDLMSNLRIGILSGKREYAFPVYDILNDICVHYAKDFFGGWYMVATHQRAGQNPITPCEYVLCCLQMNQKAKAELYIERHCIFLNKKT